MNDIQQFVRSFNRQFFAIWQGASASRSRVPTRLALATTARVARPGATNRARGCGRSSPTNIRSWPSTGARHARSGGRARSSRERRQPCASMGSRRREEAMTARMVRWRSSSGVSFTAAGYPTARLRFPCRQTRRGGTNARTHTDESAACSGILAMLVTAPMIAALLKPP